MNTVLTIAGSDSGGGAGIQADIKTMMANGVYAMSAITALTAQNTLGVTAVYEVTPEFLAQQIDAVFEDIRPDAVKVGMLSSAALAAVVADRLKFHNAENIVIDPVMVATSGARLMHQKTLDVMKKELLTGAALVTPNIPEAEVITGLSIRTYDDMLQAAKCIFDLFGCSALVKGGHAVCDANDVLYSHSGHTWFGGKRINTVNTHGTGCTLSSAIASNLAKGFSLEQSVRRAKEYISGALGDGLNLGKGSGPMNHAFDFKG